MYVETVKRLLDVAVSSIAMALLAPVYLFTVIAIKLSSPGPAFYHSYRAGVNKKPFKFYKFRSMHEPKGKNKNLFIADPDRVFAFGKLIRRLKIDELPQLLNVIKGDMSIVGPRPMRVERVNELYIGKYEIVSTIKPGLTSAASLFDYTVGDTYSNNESYKKEVLPIKLEMELMYVERQSFSYDASLVWRTAVTILQVMTGKHIFAEQPEMAEARRRAGL